LEEIVAQKAQAGESVKAERGRFQPEVYLFGKRELNQSDLTSTDPHWVAGIGLNFPLLDRSNRMARVRAARSQVRRVEYLEAEARRKVTTLVEKNRRELQNAVEQYQAYGPTMELTAEVMRLRQTAFAEGLAT